MLTREQIQEHLKLEKRAVRDVAIELIADSHIAALDEIERLKAELAAKEPETTTVKLPPYRHKDGCIKVCYSCEKCGYEHEHFDYNFCPDCGRKIERSDKE